MHESLGFENGQILSKDLSFEEAEEIYSSVLSQADDAYDHFK